MNTKIDTKKVLSLPQTGSEALAAMIKSESKLVKAIHIMQFILDHPEDEYWEHHKRRIKKFLEQFKNWQPIETAPKDGTTIEVSFDEKGEETCLAFWSERPVCMLGYRAGGHPAGWATSPEGNTDSNLPLDTPMFWKPV